LIGLGLIGITIGLITSGFFSRSEKPLVQSEATQMGTIPTNPEVTGVESATVIPTYFTRSTQFREKDGTFMVYVAVGEFEMGSATGEDDEQPVRKVYLDAYWIDKYEVYTSGYQRGVDDGACTEPEQTGSNLQVDYVGYSENYRHPMIHISWYQARDYCQWVGGDLPTEAQWEKAARGVDGLIYPWGNTNPDTTKANFNNNIGDPVGTGYYRQGDSPYGALDMAGNVWEWVLDWYGPYDAADTNNPLGPMTGEFKVFRGGSWKDDAWDIRTTSRYAIDPSSTEYNTLGFRCVILP
jgi:serine/threonine-protein kinase